LSTDRVLTISYIEGESLGDFLKRKPSGAMRDLLGTRILEMYRTQIYRLNALHADHHPGNYLFQSDGHIGLVDFGCVKRMSFNLSELDGCHCRRSWRESEAAARHFLALAYGPRAPYSRARKMLPMMERMSDAFYPQSASADIVIDYRDPKSYAKFREISRQHQKLVLQNKLINPEFAFLIRANIGLGHLLHELGATVNISEVRRRVPAAPLIGHYE
jgi:hypothetical protein